VTDIEASSAARMKAGTAEEATHNTWSAETLPGSRVVLSSADVGLQPVPRSFGCGWLDPSAFTRRLTPTVGTVPVRGRKRSAGGLHLIPVCLVARQMFSASAGGAFRKLHVRLQGEHISSQHTNTYIRCSRFQTLGQELHCFKPFVVRVHQLKRH
jgi:hypothetical protein